MESAVHLTVNKDLILKYLFFLLIPLFSFVGEVLFWFPITKERLRKVLNMVAATKKARD